MTKQPYSLMKNSPWPIILSFSLFNMMSMCIMYMYKYNMSMLFMMMNSTIMLLNCYQWWRDMNRESTFQGMYTYIMMNNYKLSMITFIMSEILFFISFFWCFFHFYLSPDIEIGLNWPPSGITPFNPYSIPLLNTMILLSSGFSLTWSHHSIITKNYNMALYSLLLTIIMGIIFTMTQMYEYMQASFCLNDSNFGSIFYLSTGFHGVHVIIGTLFLMVNMFRMYMMYFNKKNHFSFEAAAWYWHFVDVIWIMLYSMMYWMIF
uniref:Cytochrome c oxidase subunit 3 n=1 Tax=Ptilonyssus chloris TaxID=2652178 RepID=A0A5Q0S297_9ACAR|nr:cytochrome c oxidase subunit III [Ptilonyssus chloris]QGA47497.1 cytochrome c oxidase subunit III [Ptilonyssus chloris]